MARVKEAVKSSLVGTAEEPQPSQHIKANFLHRARKDETTGEWYMTEEDFVDAIAPKNQDYVSVLTTILGEHGTMLILLIHSIRSSVNNTASSFMLLIGERLDVSISPTGRPLRTC
jgi:hypothetical protein